MHTKIKHATAENRHNSIEQNILRLRRIITIGEAIHLNNDSKYLLCQILKPELRVMLEIAGNIYAGLPIPHENNNQTILDMKKETWLIGSTITSRQIRQLIRQSEPINNTKLTALALDEATTPYKSISKRRST